MAIALTFTVVDLSTLAAEPYPSASMVVGGIVAIVVAAYGRRDDSYADEIGTVIAFILGIAISVVTFAVVIEGSMGSFSVAVLALLALCLFMKPLKGIPWAVVFGLIAGAAAATAASFLLPSEVLGAEEWKILLVVFLIVGGVVWFSTRIIEGLLSVSSTVANWKVSIMIIGGIAIAEGMALLLADASLASYL
ncbi:MAG: hypothetical protein JSU93_03990 [Methanobacteriota archaeon]|nr:MAG: hypothetical protein JSU93_03990 [Euryarchaeota archaeon]